MFCTVCLWVTFLHLIYKMSVKSLSNLKCTSALKDNLKIVDKCHGDMYVQPLQVYDTEPTEALGGGGGGYHQRRGINLRGNRNKHWAEWPWCNVSEPWWFRWYQHDKQPNQQAAAVYPQIRSTPFPATFSLYRRRPDCLWKRGTEDGLHLLVKRSLGYHLWNLPRPSCQLPTGRVFNWSPNCIACHNHSAVIVQLWWKQETKAAL